MVARFFIGIALFWATAVYARDEKPNPKAAIENFIKYQQFAKNRLVAGKYLARIEKAVGRSSIYSQARSGKVGPVLVFVYFSGAHYKTWMPGYLETNEKLLNFVRQEAFSKHLYQFGDLRPDQARQSVWQLAWQDRVVRVEITPNNAVTVAFYSQGDFMAAMDTNRAALPLPFKGW